MDKVTTKLRVSFPRKRESIIAFIGLGSNVGNRKKNILRAVSALSEKKGISLKSLSTLIETKAVGLLDQPEFINAVAEVETLLDPFEFRDILQEIERCLGRVRTQRWGPRIIDLDILFYGNQKIQQESLHIPHPEIANRPFIIAALQELGCTGLMDPRFRGDDKN